MEITTYEHNEQGTRYHQGPDPIAQAAHNTGVAMRLGCDLLQVLLDAFSGTARDDTPPELPANVVAYPQHVGPRAVLRRPQPASVELCPSSGAHPDMDIATLYSRVQRAGAQIKAVTVRGRRVQL